MKSSLQLDYGEEHFGAFAVSVMKFAKLSTQKPKVKVKLQSIHSQETSRRTSSWTSGGKAARNSGLTLRSVLPSFSSAAVFLCEAGGGCRPNCSASTSRRMASGRASRNEGSTPSGMGIPSIVKAAASPLVPGCSESAAGPASASASDVGVVMTAWGGSVRSAE